MNDALMILAIFVAGGLLIGGAYYFFNLSKDKQLQIVQEWLLLAVIEAEKALGNGTGQIKLRYVYDLFITRFKFLSMFITFERFSLLVDQALLTMKDMIQNNKQVKNYIESRFDNGGKQQD